MTKKIGDKKVGKVRSTEHTKEVEKTEGVTGVSSVEATSAVGGVKRTGAIEKRRPTRTMTLAEREQLFRMIGEEADKMFGEKGIAARQKEVLTSAVKMAVDIGLVDDDSNDGDDSDGKKRKK